MSHPAYFPLDSDEPRGDAPTASKPPSRVRSTCALREYGAQPLAAMLAHYDVCEQVRSCGGCLLWFVFSLLKCTQEATSSRFRRINKRAQLFLLSSLLLICLPHTMISFIFMYSNSDHIPFWLLILPLILCRKQSAPVLTGCIVVLFAFWHDFGFFDSAMSFLCSAFPSLMYRGTKVRGCNFRRVLRLCSPLQAKLYSSALLAIQFIAILVVLRYSVCQVPQDDTSTLRRNWFRACAGFSIIIACFLFMCCLDAARLGHPFSSSPSAVSSVSAMSVAANIRSFAALSACVTSNEGRLFCSNNEFRNDRDGIISVFDVHGMNDFSGASTQYGFGMQLLASSDENDFGRVESVSVGGTHVCVVASKFFLADRRVLDKVWYWPWFMRDGMMWGFRNYSAVACWGYNDHGQLGTGFATRADDRKYGTLREYNEIPDEVTRLSQFSAVENGLLLPDDKVAHLAAGHCHTCALTLLGSLFCWGCNKFGQVGSPLHCPHKTSCNSPALVSFSHMNVTLPIIIAAAADNTCAIVAPHGKVVCWGRNNRAQLGRSAELPDPFAPVEENSDLAHSEHPWSVDGLPDGAVSLAIGREHACAFFPGGILWCWGSNQWHQMGAAACGVDSTCRRPVAVHLGRSSDLEPQLPISICAGNRITCGLVGSRLHCLGAFANRSLSDFPLILNDYLPRGFQVFENAISVVCSVNDRSPRLGLVRPHPERDELDEYSASVSKYAVKSIGLIEGICVRNTSGHISCVEVQPCSEAGDSCVMNGSFVTAFISQHERVTLEVEVGIYLFVGHTWYFIFYYRYFLLTLLKRLFQTQKDLHHEVSVSANEFFYIELEQIHEFRDCVAQLRSKGFCPDAARQAAAATGGDLQAALAWLLEHPGAPYEDVLHSLGFSVMEKIGQGGFGSVYRCSTELERGRSIAVKVISYEVNSKDAQYAVREGQRLANCHHENIIGMYKVHQPLNFPGICVFEMEFVSGGDLRRILKHRLPHDCVLRFTTQLLNALVYLHESKQLLHGDIKPHNILIKSDLPSIDDATVDYARSVLKLADFGLAKSFAPAASCDSTTRAGAGTEWYMSSEALKGHRRCYADDIWSACLVILEMDTGVPLQQLMLGPGCVNINELLVRVSPELLPVLHSVLSGNGTSRHRSARDLLRHLETCIEAIFEWQEFDGFQYVTVPAAASFVLENAFMAGLSKTNLQLPPPLDLEFDIKAVCDKTDGLGMQTHALSICHPRPIRRILKPHVFLICLDIPIWQQLICGKEWQQCSPQLSAKLEFEHRMSGAVHTAVTTRRLLIQRNTLGSVVIPFLIQREPYCVSLLSPVGAIIHQSVTPGDIDALSARVHESLPEFDITHLEAVVNQTLESKYAGYRQRITMRCNGNPNERFLFHFCPEIVIPKIWQEGEGHDTRLSQWAEVGKGAYFSEHVIYGYAYKFNLWEGGTEPAIGETFRVFVTLVTLGNCKDLHEGCGTCTSPEWEEWKKEFAPMKIDNPTRPPEYVLPSNAGERKHILDLMGVKDKPRYDSVTSTEGDLGTSPASTYMNKAKTHLVRDVMHPRLLQRPREWGRQYVVFDTAASYPLYILTLTKQRQ